MLTDGKLIPESILFDELRNNSIIDKETFSKYLNEIYKDLAEYWKKEDQGIQFSRFSDLIQHCPVFLLIKFFNSLLNKESQSDSNLSLNEFLSCFMTLKFGTYEEVVGLIFNIFDFDRDGIIKPEDVKLVISFLPLKENKDKVKYLYQMESLDELDQLIESTFNNSKIISLSDFINYTNSKANIFLMVFCYLYSIIPMFDKDINIVKRKNSEKSIDSESSNCSNKSTQGNSSSKSEKRLLFSSTVFSPIADFRSKLRNTSIKTKSNLLSKLSKNQRSLSKTNDEDLDKPILKSLKSTGVIPIDIIEIGLDTNIKDEIFVNVSLNSLNEKLIIPSKFLKSERSNLESLIKLISKTTIIESTKEASNNDIFASMAQQELHNDNETKPVLNAYKTFEGDLFRFKKVDGKLCLNNVYITLIGQSIYYYKDNQQKREDYIECHYLRGCFFKENGKESIGMNYFYSFSIIFPNGVITFYQKDQEEIKNWIKHFRDALNHQNLFDFYTIGETIGKGQFGLVKVGFDVKTKEKVAIKILNKSNIKKLDQLNLMRFEIAIMKHCKHPNIIRFIANYENSDYMFIVMEYLKSGTLKEYLDKIPFRLTEKEAANICYQIADTLLYLRKYGIIHRDLKPENILIKIEKVKGNIDKESSDQIIVKLMDFGLSKILGNTETTNEGYGTMAYIAPEILLRSPYNYKVDVWSLGVIIFNMLSGNLPNITQTDYLGVVTLHNHKQPIKFPKIFEKVSKEAINLIKGCLEKSPENRTNIEDVVLHKWFLLNKLD